MKVLSLFDGISVARYALDRLGAKHVQYYASEIDVYCRQIARKNYPDTISMGGVHIITKDKRPELFDGSVDLLIGGSPCQDLSIAKANRQGLKGNRSGLFWEYVRIVREAKPKYFVLENVASMPKEDKDIITAELGVEPIMIDAALVSAQKRKRLFWTNIPNITQPKDRGILLNDIIEEGVGVSYDRKNGVGGKRTKVLALNASNWRGINRNQRQTAVLQFRRSYWRKSQTGKVPTLTANMGTGGHNVPYIEQTARGKNKGGNVSKDGKAPTVTSSSFEHNNKLVFVGGIGDKDRAGDGKKLSRNYPQGNRVYSAKGKAASLSSSGVGGAGGPTGLYETEQTIRKLTPVECERLQSLPDNYTAGVSDARRYETIGNAFNAEVIVHILSHIPKRVMVR